LRGAQRTRHRHRELRARNRGTPDEVPMKRAYAVCPKCGFKVEVEPGDEHYVQEGRLRCSSQQCHPAPTMDRPFAPVLQLKEQDDDA
jgi:DNA-directed RNA polymerase subunit RPC12/RpoP